MRVRPGVPLVPGSRGLGRGLNSGHYWILVTIGFWSLLVPRTQVPNFGHYRSEGLQFISVTIEPWVPRTVGFISVTTNRSVPRDYSPASL